MTPGGDASKYAVTCSGWRPHSELSCVASQIRELADTFSSPTWYNKSNDLDDKYGKKFNKQGKFTWVADYKSARRLREQIVDSKKSDDLIEHPTRMGDDLPVSSSLSATNASLSEYFGQAAAVPRNPVKDYQLRDDAV